MGCEQVAAVMTVGQLTEVVAIAMMELVPTSMENKVHFDSGSGMRTTPIHAFAVGAENDSLLSIMLGVALHGICWSYFFEAGKVFLARRIESEIRLRYSLLTLLTNGIGGLVGTAIVGWAHSLLIDETTGSGWSQYEQCLTAMCGFCMIVFMMGYRGNKPAPRVSHDEHPQTIKPI